MKKFSLLFFMTLLSTLMASAYDAEVNGIYYNFYTDTKKASVTSGDTKYTGSVKIPATVTYNDVAYSVTSIGGLAFYDCSGLTYVTIPNSVTSIGTKAFYNCSGLTSITIPNSVTEIGDNAFYGCFGLTSVHIKDLAAWCKIYFSDNPLYYAKHLFMGKKEIKDLVIPNSVTSIDSYAFYGCCGLTSVTIPNSVTSIGNDAFSQCPYLTSVNIPNSVTSIGESAFSYCSSMKEVIIPNSVTSIGMGAFYHCTGELTVNCDIPSAATNATGVFIGSKFSSVTIGKDVKSIGYRAFASSKGLTSVTIGNSVTSIGVKAFNDCTALTSVTIPNSVTTIENEAFHGCSSLTSVTIPNSVTYICEGAFSNCSGLTEVYCNAENIPNTGKKVFSNVPLSSGTLHIPAASVDAYKAASPWSRFGTIVAIPDGGLRGDVNGDGNVNGTDIQAIINLIVAGEYDEKADVNEDGNVNGTDIQEVINIIVNADE